MLLAASGVTVLLSIAILLALCCQSKKKKAMFSVLHSLIHVGIWLVVAVLYRVGKARNDLWGWSCSSEAEKIQSLYRDELNFSAMCNTQVSFFQLRGAEHDVIEIRLTSLQTASWHVSMVEVGVKVILSGAGYYFARKQNGVRAKIVSSIGDAAFDQVDF